MRVRPLFALIAAAVGLVGCGGSPAPHADRPVRTPLEPDLSVSPNGAYCAGATAAATCTQALILRDDVPTTDAILVALTPWGRKLTSSGDTLPAEVRFTVRETGRRVGGEHQRGHLTVGCPRSSLREIDWLHVTPTALRVLCAVDDPALRASG